MRYCIIDAAGVTLSVIIWDGESPLDLPAGQRIVPEADAPASTAQAAPAVPDSVTNFQARAILMQMPSATAGRTLFQDVDDAIKALGGAAFQAWEFANDFTRDGALVRSMAAQFGLTSAQLDTLFIQAAQIWA